jgi:hypothetical protein
MKFSVSVHMLGAAESSWHQLLNADGVSGSCCGHVGQHHALCMPVTSIVNTSRLIFYAVNLYVVAKLTSLQSFESTEWSCKACDREIARTGSLMQTHATNVLIDLMHKELLAVYHRVGVTLQLNSWNIRSPRGRSSLLASRKAGSKR